jgi:hypothetical protein
LEAEVLKFVRPMLEEVGGGGGHVCRHDVERGVSLLILVLPQRILWSPGEPPSSSRLSVLKLIEQPDTGGWTRGRLCRQRRETKKMDAPKRCIPGFNLQFSFGMATRREIALRAVSAMRVIGEVWLAQGADREWRASS